MAFPDSAAPGTSDQNVPIFYVSQVWPWGYADRENGGRPAGKISDFARRLAQISGVPLHVELRPHRRVIADLAQGRSGFAALFKADEPPGSAVDLGEIATTDIVLANNARKTKRAISLRTLPGKSIAFINGTSYGPGFDKNDAVRHVPVRDLFQAIDLLKMGRVDGIISSDQAFYLTLQAMSLKASDFNITRTRRNRVAHLYMDRKSPWHDKAEKLKAALEVMRKSGELAQIFSLPQLERANGK